MSSGTIIVKDYKALHGGVALSARVFYHDQKKYLDAQLGRLSAFAVSKGLSVSKAITERGLGKSGQESLTLTGSSTVRLP